MNSHEPTRREVEVEVENVTRLYEYFICSTCGKVFREAVKVRNLLTSLGETYYACPRCFTEVDVQESPPKSPSPETPTPLTPPTLPTPSLGCPHYENLKKRLIPNECLVCSKLIECTKKS